ncbi:MULTISPECIES: MATE family efflux transporter [unclassified Saccharibacter]|uniref:MATE family efflux transporter n=1 Tax=unclassified Saccharibacter TaxID=2648722 RepID=UPI001324166B|nr:MULTISPECIES: MATE family efflux transporter [unclassified Saccharibacter]MXV36109.1 MATE family efflux transporter [Saccharibacter sp. EH611]MXV56968.1 MATE family efflux transporter [Saccharibacter sp. EH70]MXV66672.1 MATE family efflux transporter [Saccharibacter sp. EH60]
MNPPHISLSPSRTSFSAHAKSLFRVGLPLALSQVSEMAMGVTDTILLGSLGVEALAVGGIANNFFFTTMVTFQAILGGVGVLLSHARGAEEHGRVASYDGPRVMSAGFALSVLVFIPCLILLLFSGQLFALLGEPAEVVQHGNAFIHILLYSLLPDLALIGVCRVALPSLGYEAMLLWVMPLMAVLNGITNATLIHGWFGFPAYGLFGSARATTLTGWVIGLALIGLCLCRAPLRKVMKLVRVRWVVLKELLRLGGPMMASAASEILLFQITTLRAGQLGTQSLAAHQVALNTASLLFMVCLAVGQAANVRVAYWRGAGHMDQARRAALSALGIVLVWTFATGLLLFFLPDVIAKLYYTGAPPDEATFQTTMLLLRIAGIFQIVDGLQTVCNGALRGCGDAMVPMVIGIMSYGVVGIGGGGLLAFQGHFGVEGLWIGLASGLGVTAVALGYRLYRVLQRG